MTTEEYRVDCARHHALGMANDRWCPKYAKWHVYLWALEAYLNGYVL